MQPFDYLRNRREERRALREQETPEGRAATVTANATWWMAAFTFVLMLVGIGTVLVGVGTLWILNNQLQEMQEEQRAWVGVQGTTAPTGFTETEALHVQVVFINSGRTPARNLQVSAMYIASPVPISGPPQDKLYQLTFRPAQSIAPQGTYHENLGSMVGPESVSDLQKSGQQTLLSQYSLIKNKKLFLYYFGTLKYDDNFGKPHETEYCIYLANPDTKEIGFCDSFNDLT